MSDELEQYLIQLRSSVSLSGEDVPESLAYMLSYYRRQAHRLRLWFRIAGISLIVFSATLPLLVAFGNRIHLGPWYLEKDATVATVSARIAILTSLLSFFRWEVGWRGA